MTAHRVISATTITTPQPVNTVHLQNLTPVAITVVLWVIVGCVFIWLAAFIGELVLERLKPAIMILVVAVFVGIIFSNVIAQI